MHRKGQLFTEDFAFAFIAVLFLLVLLLVIADHVSATIESSRARGALDYLAASASDQLLLTTGRPANWAVNSTINSSAISSLGLSSTANVLDGGKVTRFFNATYGSADYNETKALLGLSGPYGFNASLSYPNGTAVYQINASPPMVSPTEPSLANTTASVNRLALLNDSIVIFNLGVWIE